MKLIDPNRAGNAATNFAIAVGRPSSPTRLAGRGRMTRTMRKMLWASPPGFFAKQAIYHGHN